MALKRALALDPGNVTALLAHLKISLMQWKWRTAADSLRRAERHGSGVTIWHARSLLFSYMALPQLALPSAKRAAELDPLSFIDHYNVALYELTLKRSEAALAVARNAYSLQPGNQEALSLICRIEAARGRFESARHAAGGLSARLKAGADSSPAAECEFYLAVAMKDYPTARKVADLAAVSYPASGVSAADIGIGYALANDVDKAISWLERAYDLREPWLFELPYTTPDAHALYADPRCLALRARPEVRVREHAREEIARGFAAMP